VRRPLNGKLVGRPRRLPRSRGWRSPTAPRHGASEDCVGQSWPGNLCKCNVINILKLAKYLFLEALPASHMDVGDVDKWEYQVLYHMIGCQQAECKA
jgi:hypothetical protein